MSDRLETKSGIVLTLRPVNWEAAWNIIRKIGSPEILSDPERLREFAGSEAFRAADVTTQLFNYCAGWGVMDEPPADALEELEALGFSGSGKSHLARANWLRFLVLEDSGEVATLIAQVLGLTWQQEMGLARPAAEEERETDGS